MANETKWQRRSEIKAAMIHERTTPMSGTALNLAAGLPGNAVWRESNFGEAV